MSESETVEFCGVRFWNGPLDNLIATMAERGGYLVVPAAPAMCEMPVDLDYAEALQKADFAVIDSGFVAILMTLERRGRVNRISGLRFLQRFLDPDGPIDVRREKLLWVVPSREEQTRLARYLAETGFVADRQNYYLAPFYRTAADFEDSLLAAQIEHTAPDWVVVCIGGGKQEKLAYRMRHRFGTRVKIVCIGAAIAFLTGGQARIPVWADRLFLGWFFRLLENPRLFGKRYLSALRLPLVVRQLRGNCNKVSPRT